MNCNVKTSVTNLKLQNSPKIIPFRLQDTRHNYSLPDCKLGTFVSQETAALMVEKA
jgi:hypothetical protein